MKQKIVHITCLAFLGMALSGCGRLVDWGKRTLHQGDNLAVDTTSPHAYVRSIILYDQFATIAMFDAIWLSDAVRTAYTDIYALKYGKDEEQKKVFLRRQFAENRHFITFFVLSTTLAPISEENSEWTLFLQIGDETFAPQEIKKIALDPEYKAFFGKHFNRFKLAYRVTFDANDSEEVPLLREDTPEMTLYFRSVYKEARLCWDLNKLGAISADSMMVPASDTKAPVASGINVAQTPVPSGIPVVEVPTAVAIQPAQAPTAGGVTP